MAELAIHFAGRLQWLNPKTGVRTTILPGWAACCSDLRADRIRQRGNHTRNAADVTCRACRKLMLKSEARLDWKEGGGG